jgi:DNA gyrase/topoisomerase IV subunit A
MHAPSPARQVAGHGNFGSLDNDPAAAMRYTECRLQAVSSSVLLADLEFDTVDWAPNFDGSQVRRPLQKQRRRCAAPC